VSLKDHSSLLVNKQIRLQRYAWALWMRERLIIGMDFLINSIFAKQN